MKYQSKSVEETAKIASELAKRYLNNGGIIALEGDLGAGKTTFTQAFAKALNIKDKIISPTFVLMRQHNLPNSQRVLFHLDLYRLEGNIHPEELGIPDMMTSGDNIILIEWSEKITDKLTGPVTTVTIKKISQNEREIEIN